MVRAFESTPVASEKIDELLELSRRAPSAGNSQAVGFAVLDSPTTTGRYWAITLPEPKRSRFRWQGLLAAPVLVLVTTRPSAYTDRYREDDKSRTGLGASLDEWPVPYWWVDAGAAIQNLLLLAVDRGLGACLFGPFEHEPALRDAFGLDSGQRIVATIALGCPLPDEPGRSSGRGRAPVDAVIVRPT
jgi:nitroreductase